MSTITTTDTADPEALRHVADAAIGRIAPVWPLKDFVAVNPYLGLAHLPFTDAARHLSVVSGISSTMSVDYYLEQIEHGRVDPDRVREVLSERHGAPADLDGFLGGAQLPTITSAVRVPTLAEIAARRMGIEVGRLVQDQVTSWAASQVDEGQAQWSPARGSEDLYAAWRRVAEVDRTPDVVGLRGARRLIAALPRDPDRVLLEARSSLGVRDDELELYFERLLRDVGGWSATLAHRVWAAELVGTPCVVMREWLAILVSWDLVTARIAGASDVVEQWRAQLAHCDAAPQPATPTEVLHEALERCERHRLVRALSNRASNGSRGTGATRPSAQLVFCIDVRSEVLRRHLETDASDVETLGFAGFFGMPFAFSAIGHDDEVAQCPVLLAPSQPVRELIGDETATRRAAGARSRSHQVRDAWKSFKMGAVSCFSFVGPVGLAYLPKLFTDGFGRTVPVRDADAEGLPRAARATRSRSVDISGIAHEARVDLAEGALRGMSLTRGFGRLLVLVAHGSSSTNNPHARGLDCGACGGHSGDVNARAAAVILNDADVRRGLRDRGIDLPDDTVVVGARHDTTTDEVELYDADVPLSHRADVAALVPRLSIASQRTALERAGRIGVGADELHARARDWAQVRPEWGLAGCQAFVAAPRSRTAGVDLGSRAFLHSYDWREDEGFAVLELIMTAPMVVASWISLQYFASTVDNEAFGAGNKTLHNVVGRLGVLEGTAGDLRTGLPWQSIHDGQQFQHVPVRLSVLIEAPTDAIDAVLASNPGVADLVVNEWIHLHSIRDDGSILRLVQGNWTSA